MTADDDRGPKDGDGDSPAASALTGAMGRAQAAIGAVKSAAADAGLDQVGAKAASAASELYRQGRDQLTANEDLNEAAERVSAAIRRNPLAAVGVAFSAGLLLALITRG